MAQASSNRSGGLGWRRRIDRTRPHSDWLRLFGPDAHFDAPLRL